MHERVMLKIVLLVGLAMSPIHPAFAQISEKNLKPLSKHHLTRVERDSSQTLLWGKVLNANEFRKITKYTKSKAIVNPLEFCVGIINDEEKALSLEGLNFRQYQNQYAIDQIIFMGKTANLNVIFDSIIWDKNTLKDTFKKNIKTLKAEVIAHAETGYLVDGLTHAQYEYTSLYSIRKWNQDDLIYAYFNGQKLIGLQYIVQC